LRPETASEQEHQKEGSVIYLPNSGVASGFSEVDVRRRIARQITDADRIEAADVVFSNDSTLEVLRDKMLNWWKEYEKTI
jgi:hypothetical protein